MIFEKKMIIGKEIYKFAKQIWPLNRSLTGEGVRETLRKINSHIPNLVTKSIKTGTKVFDWTIPKEWLVNDAYIITPDGNKVCDFKKNNLHLIGYSIPFKGEMSLNELKKHLYTLPNQPNAIPYITSYYEKRWGFCISQNNFNKLKKGIYKVVVDTKLFNGVLNYGELYIPGKIKKEIFLSTYICHPSMANNELSGIAVLTFLSQWLEKLSNREFSYRIVFVPETIGSITYLSINYKKMKKNICAGFNITCVGDDRKYSYLPPRNGSTISDDVAKHILRWIDPKFINYTWLDRGSDERQYCAPGIDLPIASIMRSKYGEYPEYHTSLDNFENVVSPEGLNGGYWAIRKALELLERNKKFQVTKLCEPQMSKRKLYSTLSTKKKNLQTNLMMDFLSLCDGKTPLLDVANKLNVPAWELYDLVEVLKKKSLIIEKKK